MAGTRNSTKKSGKGQRSKRTPQAASSGIGAKQARTTRPGVRLDRLVRLGLITLTLVVLAGLAYIPASDYLRLRQERDQVELEADVLRATLEQAEIDQQIAESRNEQRARCFGYWVEPETESYLVQVGNGCAQGR